MKSILPLALCLIGAISVSAVSASPNWAPALDSRPEALVLGATLLALASALRQKRPTKNAK